MTQPDGTLKKSSYGSQTTDYSYNLASLLTEVNNANGSTQISKYSYTYYVDGNQESKTESVAGVSKGTTNYTYDGVNRLVKEQTPDNTYSYQYDIYGNRSQLSVTGNENYTTSYTYDKNNRLRNQTKKLNESSETTDFWYDPNGNQISSMTTTASSTGAPSMGVEPAGGATNSYSEYDSWNQLTRTMQNGKTTSYTYNGDGLRMSKTVDGVTTSHIWDGTNIAGDVTNGTVTKYIRGIQLISSKKGSNESFYTYNGHGDVVQLTNSSGNITKQYSYDAFGVEINKADNDTNPFRYCGEYYDTETDSTYLRARYYKPVTGRFISEDPARDGLNWYAYCGNNPVIFVDPRGMSYDEIIYALDDIYYARNIMECYASYTVEFEDAYDIAMNAKAIIANEVEYYENWGGIADALNSIVNGDNNSLDKIYNAIEYVKGAKIIAHRRDVIDEIAYFTISTMTIAAFIKGGRVLGNIADTNSTLFNFSETAAKHMSEAGRYVPIQILQQAIEYGESIPDPQGSNAYMYYISMIKNGKEYTLEVLYDIVSNTIYHFKYWR